MYIRSSFFFLFPFFSFAHVEERPSLSRVRVELVLRGYASLVRSSRVSFVP